MKLPLALAPLVISLACGRSSLDDLLLDASGAGGGGFGGSSGRGVGASGGDGNAPSQGGDAGGSRGGTSGASVGGASGASVGGGSGVGGAAAGAGGIGGASGASGAGRGAEAGAAGRPDARCGDGSVDPGESCDPGSDPAPFALEIRQGDLRVEVLPLVGPSSATDFYAYRSASAHTGFEAVGASRIYLYRWSAEQALSLVMHHGIDAGSGVAQPESSVIFGIQGSA